jgi:CheY-like chemotaxis protein
MSEKRTVLLVDDHELVRFGVKTMYAELMGVAVEWLEAGSLQEAVDTYTAHGAVDAVLLDLNLADCKGLQGLRMFLQAHPKARVAVFSGTQDEFVIRQARCSRASPLPRCTTASPSSDRATSRSWSWCCPAARTRKSAIRPTCRWAR